MYRSSFRYASIVYSIAQRLGIKVVQQPGLDTAATDGTTVFIGTFPSPMELAKKTKLSVDRATELLDDLIAMLCMHEALHCKYTDFSEKSREELGKAGRLCFQIHNIVEDGFIEQKATHDFAGAASILGPGNDAMFEVLGYDANEPVHPVADLLNWLNLKLIHRNFGSYIVKKYLDVIEPRITLACRDDVFKIANLASQESSTQKERHQAAIDIFELLKKEFKDEMNKAPDPKSAKPQSQNQQGQPQQGQSSQGQGQQGQGQSSQAPQSSQGQQSAQGQGQGKSDQSKDAKKDQSAQGTGDKSQDKAQDAQGQGQGQGDSKDGQDGQDSKGSSGADQKGDQGGQDSASGQGNQDGQSGQGSQGSKGQGDSKNQSQGDSGSPSSQQGDQSGQGGGSGTGAADRSMVQAIIQAKNEDIPEMDTGSRLAPVITKPKQEITNQDHVDAQAFNSVMSAGSNSSNSRSLNAESGPFVPNRLTQIVIDNLGAKLDQKLQAWTQTDQWESDEGFVNIHGVSEMLVGNCDSLFLEESIERSLEGTCVHILIDCSGSMGCQVQNGSALDVSKAGVAALAINLDRLNIPFAISAFEGSNYRIKSFEEKWQKAGKSLETLTHMGGTKLAELYNAAAYELMERTEDRKILLTVSDGSPSDSYLLPMSQAIAKSMGIETRWVLIDPKGPDQLVGNLGIDQLDYMHTDGSFIAEAIIGSVEDVLFRD